MAQMATVWILLKRHLCLWCLCLCLGKHGSNVHHHCLNSAIRHQHCSGAFVFVFARNSWMAEFSFKDTNGLGAHSSTLFIAIGFAKRFEFFQFPKLSKHKEQNENSNSWKTQNIWLFSGYTKMRLPNLVEHDTLHEVIYNLQIIIIQESPPPRIFNDHISIQVSQQSMSWIPLLNIKCHPDTQLFLCSLFSPVSWSSEFWW